MARLEKLDRAAAERVDGRNVRRVIRAIEVALAGANTGPRRSDEPPYDALVIGLRVPREQLYARIDARIDGMLAHGRVAVGFTRFERFQVHRVSQPSGKPRAS